MCPNPDQQLARVQREQLGAFTRRQALAAGYSSSGLVRSVRGGSLLHAHRNVYVVASAVPTPRQRAIAAWLACGVRSAISHRSAALFLELVVQAPPLPEITVAAPRQPRDRKIHVYRSTRLDAMDAARMCGVRVTSAARTLADLAATLDEASLETALDALWRRRLVHPEPLLAYLGSPWCLPRAGTARLRSLVHERVGSRPTRSRLEVRFRQILRHFRLPLPVPDHPVDTPAGVRYIDFAYPEHKVAIELDSFEWHLARQNLDEDNARQNLLEALGWTFRRFTSTHVKDEWRVVSTVADAIRLVPSRWRPHRLPTHEV